MYKFIRKVLVFSLIVPLFYTIALLVFGMYAPSKLKSNLNYKRGSKGHLFTRLKEVNDFNNVDILFLGSSHSYRGIDTRIYKEKGLNVFNLGSSSQTPIQTLVLLNRFLDSLNPKLIIYDVYPVALSSDGVESALDLIANDKNDIHSFKMVKEIKHLKVYNTYLYGLMVDFLGLNKSFQEPLKRGPDNYISGGFVQKELAHYTPEFLGKKEIELNDKQLVSLKKVIDKVTEKGIPIALVYIPIAPSNYERYNNNEKFDSIMNEYAAFYNFNKELKLDDSLHFYDSHHLNQIGIDVFNEKLLEKLPEMTQEAQIRLKANIE